jgi:heme exporter protein CcmB
MIKINNINIYISFLLINFAFLFLSNYAIEHNTIKYIVWINANIIYLISAGNIFNQSYNSGILDQMLIQNINLSLFFAKEIIRSWLKVGIPLSIISTCFIFILSNDYYLFYFLLSLIYSTFMIAFISAFSNSLIISNFNNIIAFIISLPVILPVLITGRLINEYTISSYKPIILIVILNLVILGIIPFLISWLVKTTIEEN